MLLVYFKAFVSLFIIMDPIGNIPVFLSVAEPLEPAQRQKAYSLSVLIAFAILLIFSLIGEFVLSQLFHVEMAAIQIAGGILLFIIAIQSLLVPSSKSASDGSPKVQPEEIACVPLACPLIAGPGAMVTSLAIWHSPEAGPLAALVGIVLVLALFWMMMKMVHKISTAVAKLVITAVSKVMLVLVAALGVEMTIRGIQYYFPNSIAP